MTTQFSLVTEFNVRRLPNGRRVFLDDLVQILDGEKFTIPEGFDTNYSSWKGWLPGPDYHRIDVAGVDHDYIWRFGYLGCGLDAKEVGFWEGNRIWWQIARHGTEETAAGPIWSGVGFLGLNIGGWVSWLGYRESRREYAESLRARKKEARKEGPDGDEGTE